MVEIRLDGLTKTFNTSSGKIVAVENLDLKVTNGEFFTFLGPSGCGKTTTLRIIAGLETPTEGDVFFDNEKVTDLAPQQRDIAMVFQNTALFPHMTCYDNIGYGLKVRGDTDNLDERVRDVAELLSISDQLDKYPDQLSGGQQQRVALGRAIVRQPNAILFDEPMSDLDAKLKAELRVVLQEIYEEYGTTTVYVTHDQKEATTMSTKIGVMRSGRFEQIGTPEEIYSSPNNKFIGEFIGQPRMNFLDGKLTKNGEVELINGQTFEYSELTADDSPKRDIEFGFRPQHCSITNEKNSTFYRATYKLHELHEDDYIVYLEDEQGTEIIIEQSEKPDFEKESIVGIDFPDNYHIFDKETQNVIN